MNGNESDYVSGYEAASRALQSGYPVDGDGPQQASDSYFNGFIDRLAEAKRAAQAKEGAE
jgi:hypothetical protein